MEVDLRAAHPRIAGRIAVDADENFMLISSDQKSTILIQVDNQDVTEWQQVLSNTIDIDEGLFLQPLAEVSSDGDTIFAHFEVYGASNPSTAVLMKKFRDQTQGLFFFSITPSDNIDNFVKTINGLLASVEFFEPIKAVTSSNVSQATNQTNANNYWSQEFSGMRLVNYNNLSGFSEKETITLCSDGRYYWSRNTSTTTQNGSGGGFSDNAGSWSTSGSSTYGELTVTNQDGSVINYSIEPTSDDVGVLLNGYLYYRESAGC